MIGEKYSLVRFEHGWVLCAPYGSAGVPMNALMEVSELFGKDMVMDPGIIHSLRARGMDNAVSSVCTKEGSAVWREEIERELRQANLSEEAIWWSGCNVGTSSATIFSVLSSSYSADHIKAIMSIPSLPSDGGDFARCVDLVDQLGWRERLGEVSAQYPDWSGIVENWDRLVKVLREEPDKFNGVLKEVLSSGSNDS